MQTTHFSLDTMQVIFPDVRLHPHHIASFRGAFVEWVGREELLLHNHIDADTIVYQYPLVQYRSINAQAAIFALQEGATALRKALINAPDRPVTCAGKRINLQHFSLLKEKYALQLTEQWHTYYLNDWLALNQENYQMWQGLHRLTDKATLLEKLLTNHLVAFLKAIQWKLPEQSVRVELMDWYDTKPANLHGTAHLAFRVRYRCNLTLPDGLALGKGISHGFGTQNQMKSSNVISLENPQPIPGAGMLQH